MSGAARLVAKRRPTAPASGAPRRAALRSIAVTPMLTATAAASSQTMSHRSAELWLAARTAAARPTAPMPAPPRPGTAVNVELRSIVRRINCRLSSACWPTEVTARPPSRATSVDGKAYRGTCQRTVCTSKKGFGTDRRRRPTGRQDWGCTMRGKSRIGKLKRRPAWPEIERISSMNRRTFSKTMAMAVASGALAPQGMWAARRAS